MIIRYLIFIFFILTSSAVLSLVFKPIPIRDIRVTGYKDPVSIVRDFYAKILWKNLSTKDSFEKRFSVIRSVVDYSPKFRSAYEELCSSVEDYITSGVSTKDFIGLIKKGVDNFDDDRFIDCYVKVLTGMERYSESIDFLKSRHMETVDPYRKGLYLEKIDFFQNEKNILALTKAVETYYQKDKTYPGDILVLVDQGIIESVPDDPYGGQYFISRQGQVRSTSQRDKDGF